MNVMTERIFFLPSLRTRAAAGHVANFCLHKRRRRDDRDTSCTRAAKRAAGVERDKFTSKNDLYLGAHALTALGCAATTKL